MKEIIVRRSRQVVWLDPEDCDPPHALDMRHNYHFNKVKSLREAFKKNGFDKNHSALVGYPLNGRIQLLSGTHRHEAAIQAGIKLPVTIWLRSDIERCWGTDQWFEINKDIPVKELLCYETQSEVIETKENFLNYNFSRLDPKNMYSNKDKMR